MSFSAIEARNPLQPEIISWLESWRLTAVGTIALIKVKPQDVVPAPGQEIGQHGLPWGNTSREKLCKNLGVKACDGCRWKERQECPGGHPKHSSDPYHPGSK